MRFGVADIHSGGSAEGAGGGDVGGGETGLGMLEVYKWPGCGGGARRETHHNARRHRVRRYWAAVRALRAIRQRLSSIAPTVNFAPRVTALDCCARIR